MRKTQRDVNANIDCYERHVENCSDQCNSTVGLSEREIECGESDEVEKVAYQVNSPGRAEEEALRLDRCETRLHR
jgi:hypothetical protein